MPRRPPELDDGLDAPDGFFDYADERPLLSSDFPVSTDVPEPRPDLEEREQRRARYSRAVTRIVVGMGVATVLAVWHRPLPANLDEQATSSSRAPVTLELPTTIVPATQAPVDAAAAPVDAAQAESVAAAVSSAGAPVESASAEVAPAPSSSGGLRHRAYHPAPQRAPVAPVRVAPPVPSAPPSSKPSKAVFTD